MEVLIIIECALLLAVVCIAFSFAFLMTTLAIKQIQELINDRKIRKELDSWSKKRGV